MKVYCEECFDEIFGKDKHLKEICPSCKSSEKTKKMFKEIRKEIELPEEEQEWITVKSPYKDYRR